MMARTGEGWNNYDPETEPPLGPQRGLEEDSAVSVTSSQKALSYTGQIRRHKSYLKRSIQEAIDAAKPKWATRGINERTNMIIGPRADFVGYFPKKNLRNNPVFREIGLDPLADCNDYNYMPVRDIYKSQADISKGRLFFTNMEIPAFKKKDAQDQMNTSGKQWRYTNTCCWVKGNNPFVVSKAKIQPQSQSQFLKTHSSFNSK